MGVSHSGLANRFFAVRYMRPISWRSDFPNHAFRTKAVSKAIKKKSDRRQKIPFSIDLLNWLYENWPKGNTAKESKICTWGAITIGFCFRMRLSEIQNLRRRDASFFREDTLSHLSIFFAKSKNDRGGIGISRTLAGRNHVAFPVLGISQWVIRSDWGPDSDSPISPDNIRNLVDGETYFRVSRKLRFA